MSEVVYHQSKPADRAREAERVIDNVRAEVKPHEQAQALRDLARTADGEPQLDGRRLRAEAAHLEAIEGDRVEAWIAAEAASLLTFVEYHQAQSDGLELETIEEHLRSIYAAGRSEAYAAASKAISKMGGRTGG